MLTEKHVLINGKKAYYLTGGKGKALLFLHGWLLPSANAHAYFLELLSRHFTVYAPSLISSHTFSIRDYKPLIERFVKKLRLRDLTVIGVSFGGAIAADFSSKNRHLVQRLVLVDSMGIPLNKPLLWWIKTVASKIRNFRPGNFAASIRGAKHMLEFSLHLSKKNVINISLDITRSDFTESFRKVKCRTLILWGDDDEMFPVEHSKVIRSLIKRSKLVIVKGTHDWSIMEPAIFHNLVMAFIKQI